MVVITGYCPKMDGFIFVFDGSEHEALEALQRSTGYKLVDLDAQPSGETPSSIAAKMDDGYEGLPDEDVFGTKRLFLVSAEYENRLLDDVANFPEEGSRFGWQLFIGPVLNDGFAPDAVCW